MVSWIADEDEDDGNLRFIASQLLITIYIFPILAPQLQTTKYLPGK